MNILTPWLRSYLPELPVDDRQLAEDLTLRGIAVEGEFPLEGSLKGTLYEMDLTTNRVDAMNHYGVAREAAAIYDLPFAPLESTADVPANEDGEAFPVRIEAGDLCGRFTARVVRGVTIKPATGLVAEYFAAIGQKPISNAVDITNFGWLAMGQPTHVFDLDKLEGGIVVRRATAGEYLKFLDGTDRKLTTDDLVIADEKKALGLAGIMGGWDSRVTDETKNILVEAAWFLPATVRASSRRHGFHTDASHRFERGADFNAAPLANNLVTRMVIEQCGGAVVGPMTDVVIPAREAETAGRETRLRVREVRRHLGTTLEATHHTHADPRSQAAHQPAAAGIPGIGAVQARFIEAEEPAPSSGLSADLVARYLTALGCKLLPASTPDSFSVELPSWRLDLEREIDLVEEVARVYGYNRFANTLPSFAGEVRELPHAAQEAALRTTLRALGFSEGLSSSFCSAEAAATFGERNFGAVPMGNPLSEEAGVLRPSLLPNMADMLADNVRRDVRGVRLYELGNAFTGSTEAVTQRTLISLGLTGDAAASALYGAEDALFYEAKGALEAVLSRFAGKLTLHADDLPAWIEPGRGAKAVLNGKLVAVWGELNAAELAARKLRRTAVLAEIDAQALFETPLRTVVSEDVSRFPAVERDFSFIFPDRVSWGAIEASLSGLAIAELRSVDPLEIFRDPKGKAIEAGKYSLLTRVVFQSPDRTLTDEDLTAAAARIAAALESLGGTQRA